MTERAANERDFCAECGNPLVRLEHGAYLQCCNHAGYWSDAKIGDGDKWGSRYMARYGHHRLYLRRLGYRLVFPRSN